MKVVKKIKKTISWHLYNDREMRNVISYLENNMHGKETSPLEVFTNLFKKSSGDEMARFYMEVGTMENRLFIDNLERTMTLHINVGDIENVLSTLELFIKDKSVGSKEILIMRIAKKEYSLLAFNQQHKKYLRLEEKGYTTNRERKGHTEEAEQ